MSYRPTVDDVVAFLREQMEGMRNSKLEHVRDYVASYMQDRRCATICDGERIVAVALARCVHDKEQGETSFEHHEDGRIVWVDDIVSRHELGVGFLLEHARQRFGPREAFAGRVLGRAGELRMLPWKIVERLTMQHNGIREPTGTAGRT